MPYVYGQDIIFTFKFNRKSIHSNFKDNHTKLDLLNAHLLCCARIGEIKQTIR